MRTNRNLGAIKGGNTKHLLHSQAHDTLDQVVGHDQPLKVIRSGNANFPLHIQGQGMVGQFEGDDSCYCIQL